MPTTPASPLRTLRPLPALLGLVAALALAGCGGSGAPPVAKLSAAQVQAALAESPTTPLGKAAARLEAQAGETLDGGDDPAKALEARVAAMDGTPLVVNLWGEWCGPCKKELPIFQRVALAQRGRVAFLGVAVLSDRGKTEAYQAEQIALPYPSLLDDDNTTSQGTGVDEIPKTFFYDASGKRYVHVGPYESEADLLADIARYAS